MLIPGIQGRWEYSRAARRRAGALSSRHHVLARATSATAGADAADRLLRRPGCRRHSIASESNGPRSLASRSAGLVALRFAATRADRTAALVMVSTPGPHWHLRPRHECVCPRPLAIRAGVSRRRRRSGSAGKCLRPFPSGRRASTYLSEQLRTLVVCAGVSLAHGRARASHRAVRPGCRLRA